MTVFRDDLTNKQRNEGTGGKVQIRSSGARKGIDVNRAGKDPRQRKFEPRMQPQKLFPQKYIFQKLYALKRRVPVVFR